MQVRVDADLKEQAEELYKKLGTSFAEAVRIFAKQSVRENAMPFRISMGERETDKRIGIAEGEFVVPEDIDKYNNERTDPFDCILISQAKAENMMVITHDSLLPWYREECIIAV